MQLTNSIVFVTGANRGIGRTFVTEAVKRGAAKVYAAARDPASLADLVKSHAGKVVAIKLDITQPDQVAAAASQCQDVQVLINNAGISTGAAVLAAKDMSDSQREMAVNYFGLQSMCRAFAPLLKKNGGGAMVNLLSVVSRINIPSAGSYSASKAAAWSLTQGVRAELAAQGTLVVAVFPGAVDTDMTKGMDMPKMSTTEVVTAALDAVASGTEDVNAGEMSQGVAAVLVSPGYKGMEKQFATMLPR